MEFGSHGASSPLSVRQGFPFPALVPAEVPAGGFLLRDSLDPPASPIFEALLCRVTPFLCHMRRVVNFLDGSAFYLLGWCDNFQASYMLDWEPDTPFCVYQLEYFAKKRFLLPPVLSLKFLCGLIVWGSFILMA